MAEPVSVPDDKVPAGKWFRRHVKPTLDILAPTKEPILFIGEPGTGKGAAAEYVHAASGRTGQMVHINCAGLSGENFLSHIFGHKKGAFTGAVGDRQGAVKQAEGGTLFLDELDSADDDAQSILLVFLESGTYRPLGADDPWEAHDVRVLAASSWPDDLIDPLRDRFITEVDFLPLSHPDRRADIPAIVGQLLQRHGSVADPRIRAINSDLLASICATPWEGNVRELENWLKYMLHSFEAARTGRIGLSEDDIPRPMSILCELEGKPLHEARRIVDDHIAHLRAAAPRYFEMLGPASESYLNECKRIGKSLEGLVPGIERLLDREGTTDDARDGLRFTMFQADLGICWNEIMPTEKRSPAPDVATALQEDRPVKVESLKTAFSTETLAPGFIPIEALRHFEFPTSPGAIAPPDEPKSLGGKLKRLLDRPWGSAQIGFKKLYFSDLLKKHPTRKHAATAAGMLPESLWRVLRTLRLTQG